MRFNKLRIKLGKEKGKNMKKIVIAVLSLAVLVGGFAGSGFAGSKVYAGKNYNKQFNHSRYEQLSHNGMRIYYQFWFKKGGKQFNVVTYASGRTDKARCKATAKTIQFSGLNKSSKTWLEIKNKKYFYRFARYERTGKLYLYANKAKFKKQKIAKTLTLYYLDKVKPVENSFYQNVPKYGKLRAPNEGNRYEFAFTSKRTFDVTKIWYDGGVRGKEKGKGVVTATKNTIKFKFKGKLRGKMKKLKSGKKYYYRLSHCTDYDSPSFVGGIQLYKSKADYQNEKVYFKLMMGSWE